MRIIFSPVAAMPCEAAKPNGQVPCEQGDMLASAAGPEPLRSAARVTAWKPPTEREIFEYFLLQEMGAEGDDRLML